LRVLDFDGVPPYHLRYHLTASSADNRACFGLAKASASQTLTAPCRRVRPEFFYQTLLGVDWTSWRATMRRLQIERFIGRRSSTKRFTCTPTTASRKPRPRLNAMSRAGSSLSDGWLGVPKS